MTLHETVRASLQAGNQSAVKIRNHTGLPHEAVYQALVRMEGQGEASLVVCHPHRGPPDFIWSALQ